MSVKLQLTIIFSHYVNKMSEIIVQEDVLKIVQNLKERFANCHFWVAGTREMFDKQLPTLKVVKANFQTKYSLLMILFLNMSFSFIHVCFHHLLKLRFWKSFKMYLLMFSCWFFYNARWKHLHARTKKTCFGWFSRRPSFSPLLLTQIEPAQNTVHRSRWGGSEEAHLKEF